MKPQKKTMVCVTVQKTCERLISKGAKLAGGAELRVVHVVRNGGGVLGGKNDPECLEYLFQISRSYGAEMDMLRSDDVAGTLEAFARKHDMGCLVMGRTRGIGDGEIASRLRERLTDLEVVEIP